MICDDDDLARRLALDEQEASEGRLRGLVAENQGLRAQVLALGLALARRLPCRGCARDAGCAQASCAAFHDRGMANLRDPANSPGKADRGPF